MKKNRIRRILVSLCCPCSDIPKVDNETVAEKKT